MGKRVRQNSKNKSNAICRWLHFDLNLVLVFHFFYFNALSHSHSLSLPCFDAIDWLTLHNGQIKIQSYMSELEFHVFVYSYWASNMFEGARAVYSYLTFVFETFGFPINYNDDFILVFLFVCFFFCLYLVTTVCIGLLWLLLCVRSMWSECEHCSTLNLIGFWFIKMAQISPPLTHSLSVSLFHQMLYFMAWSEVKFFIVFCSFVWTCLLLFIVHKL